jgi:Flp pilus assembly protein TadB
MTLSDYERRVLDEIESEFAWTARRRTWRRLASLRGVWFSVLNVLVGVVICTVAIMTMPPLPAAIVASIGGVGLGWSAHDLFRAVRCQTKR